MCCGDMFCIIKEQYKPAILIYMKKSMWGKIIKYEAFNWFKVFNIYNENEIKKSKK